MEVGRAVLENQFWVLVWGAGRETKRKLKKIIGGVSFFVFVWTIAFFGDFGIQNRGDLESLLHLQSPEGSTTRVPRSKFIFPCFKTYHILLMNALLHCCIVVEHEHDIMNTEFLPHSHTEPNLE
ncbi:hypothetical protein V8G54_012601, partial [Vigna mungo]